MTKSTPESSDYDVIVVGAFQYPAGDASANRMLSLAQLASDGKRKALVVNDRPALRSDINEGIGSYGGIDYICVGARDGGRLLRLVNRWTRAARLRDVVRAATANSKQRVVITLPSGLFNVGAYLMLNRGLACIVVVDVVERHDPEQFGHGRLDPAFLRHRWTSWLASRLADGCIVISTELQRRFASECATIRIPAVVNLNEFPNPSPSDGHGPLTLLYSGNPATKDQLGSLIDAVISIQETGDHPIELRLAGPDAPALTANADVGAVRVSRFGTAIKPLGRLTRSELRDELREADFSVLFRPDRGYARAGFPTKVPESLAAGTPIFGNLSSDLSMYLVDGRNAIICASNPETGEVDKSELQRQLTELLRADAEELFRMRLAARASAVHLSVSVWSPAFVYWVESL